jgi:hypothetical protein
MEVSPCKSADSYGCEMRSVVSLDDVSDTFLEKKAGGNQWSVDSAWPDQAPRNVPTACSGFTDETGPLVAVE